MPIVRDVNVLRSEIVALLPTNSPVLYRDFLAQLSEAGLGEGQAQIDGMKANGMVERWLEERDGHPVHLIARPGVRSQS